MIIILLKRNVRLLLFETAALDNEERERETIRAANSNARQRTARVAAPVAATNYDLRHKTTRSRTHTHLLIILNRLHSQHAAAEAGWNAAAASASVVVVVVVVVIVISLRRRVTVSLPRTPPLP